MYFVLRSACYLCLPHPLPRTNTVVQAGVEIRLERDCSDRDGGASGELEGGAVNARRSGGP